MTGREKEAERRAEALKVLADKISNGEITRISSDLWKGIIPDAERSFLMDVFGDSVRTEDCDAIAEALNSSRCAVTEIDLPNASTRLI